MLFPDIEMFLIFYSDFLSKIKFYVLISDNEIFYGHFMVNELIYTAGPWIKSFGYKVDEMQQELNSCLYQLGCSSVGFVLRPLKVSEPIDEVKWGFTVCKIVLWGGL